LECKKFKTFILRNLISNALILFVLTSTFVIVSAAEEEKDTSILGFSAKGAQAQRELEATLDTKISPQELREWMKRLSAHPHHVGSPYGKENANWIAKQFRDWGYDTRIEEFRVLFPVPKERLLEMTAPTKFVAKLQEPAIPEDSTSGQQDEQLPTYNAYSIDGDVEGDLVYVHYGVPDSYEELAKRGIDVKGKIVLARYGGSWRGIKPKVAAEHGAIGCIIYSDPKEDGYFQGDTYPKGGFRSRDSVQRGSVADMPLYPGDPLTPGIAATADAKRLEREKAPTLTKIPVLPISYADAQPLLEALNGPMAPEEWRGSLPFRYRLGPGLARVHLKVKFDWKLVPAYDVIAMLKGREYPDEWILRGNHHDAWVNGAADPTSGQVAMLGEAKAIGEMAQQGFRPKRTLVFMAWDGEEPGLLGSTEWAEAHAKELQQKAVVYINTDTVSRGFVSMAGSHSLERFLNEVVRDLIDPETKVSVLERVKAQLLSKGGDRAKEIRERKYLRLDALGSGSDYTPFLQHLAIASLNLDFGGEEQYGQYHSIYDSFDHYTRFMDPDFAYVASTSKMGVRVALRLAQSELLPFETGAVADSIALYTKEVEELTDKLRKEAEERNELLDKRAFELAADPKERFVSPPRLDPVPYINFAPLKNGVEQVKAASKKFETAREEAMKNNDGMPDHLRRELDLRIISLERSLSLPDGLPGRKWFVHAVYAPGFYTGYGVKTLPAVREALELRKWSEAEAQIQIVAKVLEGYATRLDEMTAMVKKR
jgi:N-acetylated-alpha-linked acidic dipeptidase